MATNDRSNIDDMLSRALSCDETPSPELNHRIKQQIADRGSLAGASLREPPSYASGTAGRCGKPMKWVNALAGAAVFALAVFGVVAIYMASGGPAGNPLGIGSEVLPTEPEPTPDPSTQEELSIVGTWYYVTTTIDDAETGETLEGFKLVAPQIEIYEDYTLLANFADLTIKAVAIQDANHSQYEFSVVEQFGISGDEVWRAIENAVELTYFPLSDGLRWRFYNEDTGEFVNHWFVKSLESLNVETPKPAEPVFGEIIEVTVSTAEEFIGALGSNKRILMEEGVYNVSAVDPSVITSPYVFLDEDVAGNELRLVGVSNLTIVGSGSEPSEIVAEPRHVQVMSFVDCSDISISNIKAGHTEGGPVECTGGVFFFRDSSDINIDKTFMYGCGTYGLTLYRVSNMRVADSTIYDCTHGIMLVNESENIVFERCVFRDNLATAMVSLAEVSGFTIDSCEFLRNIETSFVGYVYMFRSWGSNNVSVRNTYFSHNQAHGLADPISEDIVFDPSNVFEDNSFD